MIDFCSNLYASLMYTGCTCGSGYSAAVVRVVVVVESVLYYYTYTIYVLYMSGRGENRHLHARPGAIEPEPQTAALSSPTDAL